MSQKPNRGEFERKKRALFDAAMELPEARRAGFVQERTRADAELRNAVLQLLTAGSTGSAGVLDRPVHDRQDRNLGGQSHIGDYQVVRQLGAGGMGSVYACRRAGLRGLVAVKVLHPDLNDGRFLARFQRECGILRRLHHPNVCRILDTGVAAHGAPFLVMELFEGEPMDRYCRRKGSDLSEVLRLFSQVLAGVEYFHRQDIVHRDLKPSNILVSEAGRVSILDFGIAKLAEHRPGMTGFGDTRSTLPLMTVRYASPEQLNGRLSGRSSDIYSLGLLLYELLTGQHPFAKECREGHVSLYTAMSSRAPGPPSRITRVRMERQAPPFVDGLTLKAIQFDPMRRYPSAGAFLDNVRTCLEAISRPPPYGSA